MNKEPFYFAGIWSTHDAFDVTTSAIITTIPHERIGHIQYRMPVILKEEAYEPWLDTSTSPKDTHDLLKANRGDELVGYSVSTAVNSNRSQGPELIEPVSE